MGKVLSLFHLEKEAYLLDSKLFILKSSLAVATAYLFASNNEIVSKDMISVLFGLMLTIEPVTLTGIRHGWNQIYATLLGAISTAIIIALLGINVWTIALSMGFTLYIGLKIQWREVSPVAIFTSIYMTQYVQTTATGEASIYLTMRLRLLALGTGVAVAILYNFLFSFVSYRKIAYKRMTFLLKGLIHNLEKTVEGIEENSEDKIRKSQQEVPHIFNNMDGVYGLLSDIEEENRLKQRIFGRKNVQIEAFQEIVALLRSICHLNYDSHHALLHEGCHLGDKKEIISGFKKLIEELKRMRDAFDRDEKAEENQEHGLIEEALGTTDLHKRIIHNLNEMERHVQLIKHIVEREEIFQS